MSETVQATTTDTIVARLAVLIAIALGLFICFVILNGCGDESNGVSSPDSCDVCRNVVSGVDAGDAAK